MPSWIHTRRCLVVPLLALSAHVALPGAASAAPPFPVGARVECDTVGNGAGYRPATVIAFQPGEAYNGYSPQSGYYVRVRVDGWPEEGITCKTENLRAAPAAAAPAAAPRAQPRANEPAESRPVTAGRAAGTAPRVDAAGTVGADRPILACPIPQAQARNGARPDVELLKKVLRCELGEKPAAAGYDGAVTVDVESMQVGRSRKWIYAGGSGGGDLGGGDADTVVWPIRTTFTSKTHYRSSTQVFAGSIRIFHFFVNSFGEWQSGSAENVRNAEVTSVPH